MHKTQQYPPQKTIAVGYIPGIIATSSDKSDTVDYASILKKFTYSYNTTVSMGFFFTHEKKLLLISKNKYILNSNSSVKRKKSCTANLRQLQLYA